jgi:hypothetical protein
MIKSEMLGRCCLQEKLMKHDKTNVILGNNLGYVCRDTYGRPSVNFINSLLAYPISFDDSNIYIVAYVAIKFLDDQAYAVATIEDAYSRTFQVFEVLGNGLGQAVNYGSNI